MSKVITEMKTIIDHMAIQDNFSVLPIEWVKLKMQKTNLERIHTSVITVKKYKQAQAALSFLDKQLKKTNKTH